jgi:hypothetical protein
LLLFDLAHWMNKTTGCTRYLDLMTKWDRPFLKRLQELKRRRIRYRLRSPMTYVRANKCRPTTSKTRLWRKGIQASRLLMVYCHTSLKQASRVKGFMRFDTDSFPIGVDNCATYCITDNKKDFVGPLKRSNTRVASVGGHQKGQWIGTIHWPVVDDDGRHHQLIIPNTVLIPEGSLPFRLLSPQHFGQENLKQGINTHDKGTLNLTSGVDNVLAWADLKYRITTQLTQGSNIALINSDANYTKFAAFVSRVAPPDEPLELFNAHLIPDDESIAPLPANDDASIDAPSFPQAHEGAPPTSATNTTDQPHVIDFMEGKGEFCLPTVEEAEDNESKLDNPTHELLLYHY